MFSSKKKAIETIKKKKELSGISDSIVKESLDKCLSKYKIHLENLSPPNAKIIIKEVRAELRLLTGRFQKSIKNKSKLSTSELLEAHTSTAERLEFYPILIKKIKKMKPKSILDLACGLNPLALANKELTYYASDIKEDELEIIKKFFKKKKIKGKTFVYDLRNIKTDLPNSDICLLFKVLDIIEDKHHKLSEKILTLVPSKIIIVSFSTRKLSGKKMNSPKREWFESALEKLNYPYETLSSDNEIFYIIDKP